MVLTRLELWTLWLLVGKIAILAMQTCLFRFPTRDRGVLSLSLIITLQWEINQLLKIKIKLKLTKFSQKTRSIIASIANQRVITISHSQKYSDLQGIYKSSSCVEILRVVARGDVSVFQITGDIRGARGLLWFTLEHNW